jgi:hypothetical protein
MVAGPARREGRLTVRTIPWSRVYEGSRLLGTTPLADLPLAAGGHRLTFVNPDRPTLSRAIVIRPQVETRLSIALPAARASRRE